MAPEPSSALVWFRRDLRAYDHAALSHGLSRYDRVYCAFVFDTEILDALPSRVDRRVEFILRSVAELDVALDDLSRQAGGCGSGLLVRHGRSDEEVPRLASQLGVSVVLTHRDYEPASRMRDQRVAARLKELGIEFIDFKDQVIFERDEVLTQAGQPFSVFTPYKNAWLRRLRTEDVAPWPVAERASALADKPVGAAIPDLAALGFRETNLVDLRLPTGMGGGRELFAEFIDRMASYRQARDFPAVKGVSYLSTHLRFGTVSIRQLVDVAWHQGGEGGETWLSELIWREFYQMILWHHPRVVAHAFKPEFDAVRWVEDPAGFAAWCEGRTGYPIVDAALRQLNQTGYMHNRLRMIAASFLTKDLGIDWRFGERYFAQHLNDFDLAANNGGWQWAASTGCDAQPYFRIFNPVTQSERFDPEGKFIRRYVPELTKLSARHIHTPWRMSADEARRCGVTLGIDYPLPIVDHAQARAATLARFATVRPAR